MLLSEVYNAFVHGTRRYTIEHNELALPSQQRHTEYRTRDNITTNEGQQQMKIQKL
jgi:hypothetical protein